MSSQSDDNAIGCIIGILLLLFCGTAICLAIFPLYTISTFIVLFITIYSINRINKNRKIKKLRTKAERGYVNAMRDLAKLLRGSEERYYWNQKADSITKERRKNRERQKNSSAQKYENARKKYEEMMKTK